MHTPWEYMGPAIGLSVIALSVAAVFIFRGALDFAARLLARPRDGKLVGPGT